MFEQLSTELHRTGLQIIIKATDFQREMLCSIHNGGGTGLADFDRQFDCVLSERVSLKFSYLVRSRSNG